MTAREYGYWLYFVFAAYDGAIEENPTVRVTPDRVRAYCRSMAGLSALTRASRIARLYAVLRGADKTLNLAWLAGFRRALDGAARREAPARLKDGRLVPSGSLFRAGLKLLKSAHDDYGLTPRTRARHVRDGLIIALLAARPLRIKNFSALRVGEHLHATSSGYLLEIPGRETKTGQPIESFVPEELVPWLKVYLDCHRPILLGGQASDDVWVHEAGCGYSPGSLAQRIATLTRQLVGVSISPHLFRDCAATTIATEDPEHVMIIAPLLGHTTLKTAENHYNHARCLEAGRRYQNSIRELRERMRPINRRCSRR